MLTIQKRMVGSRAQEALDTLLHEAHPQAP